MVGQDILIEKKLDGKFDLHVLPGCSFILIGEYVKNNITVFSMLSKELNRFSEQKVKPEAQNITENQLNTIVSLNCKGKDHRFDFDMAVLVDCIKKDVFVYRDNCWEKFDPKPHVFTYTVHELTETKVIGRLSQREYNKLVCKGTEEECETFLIGKDPEQYYMGSY